MNCSFFLLFSIPSFHLSQPISTPLQKMGGFSQELDSIHNNGLVSIDYKESLPYGHFRTWKKTCYMKFLLVGCRGSPTNANPPLACT